MTILLVIGGSGFFGKSILHAHSRGLLKPWNVKRILIMSRNAYLLQTTNPQIIPNGVDFISADIASVESLPFADYVIHAAASTDAANYIAQPLIERRNIQAGTYNYCRLAPKYHSKSRILFVSSGAVYGQQPPDMEHVEESYDIGSIEAMVVHKRDYALAKRDAEAEIMGLGLQGLKVSIARCFNFVGYFLPRNKHFAIGNFIEDGLNKRTVVVKAQHEVYRSHMYVDDLVRWLMVVSENSSTSCPKYNVGSNEVISMGDLAKMVATYFGVGFDIPEISNTKIDRYVPSIAKAQKDLGLSIDFKLDNALDQTIHAIKNFNLGS